MSKKLQEMLEKINATKSQHQLWTDIVEYTHSEGACQLHTWFGKNLDELTFLTTTPNWWHDYYVDENVIEYDVVAHHAIEGHGPLIYGYDKDKHNPHLSEKYLKLVIMTTSEFKYGCGITMPTFANGVRIGGINICFPETVQEINQFPTSRILNQLLVTSTAHEKLHSLSKIPQKNVLTPRQKECLTWLASGLNPQQIADKIGISFHTVKMHLDAAKERLEAESRIQAVAKALVSGQISLE